MYDHRWRLAIAHLTRDPKRVGCLIESARQFWPASIRRMRLICDVVRKLWSLHLNDQNGLKFDQDKPFGSANLRVAFNQVLALERNAAAGTVNAFVSTCVIRTTKSNTGCTSGQQPAAFCVSCKARAFNERRRGR
jgi:xylose isomerase